MFVTLSSERAPLEQHLPDYVADAGLVGELGETRGLLPAPFCAIGRVARKSNRDGVVHDRQKAEQKSCQVKEKAEEALGAHQDGRSAEDNGGDRRHAHRARLHHERLEAALQSLDLERACNDQAQHADIQIANLRRQPVQCKFQRKRISRQHASVEARRQARYRSVLGSASALEIAPLRGHRHGVQ